MWPFNKNKEEKIKGLCINCKWYKHIPREKNRDFEDSFSTVFSWRHQCCRPSAKTGIPRNSEVDLERNYESLCGWSGRYFIERDDGTNWER